jgi:hypothetical protein
MNKIISEDKEGSAETEIRFVDTKRETADFEKKISLRCERTSLRGLNLLIQGVEKLMKRWDELMIIKWLIDDVERQPTDVEND